MADSDLIEHKTNS